MNRIIKFVLPGLLLAGFVSAENSQYIKALILLKDDHYAEAEKILTPIMEEYLSPEGSDQKVVLDGYEVKPSFLYSSRARCWDGLKRHDKALDDYFKAYQLNGDRELLYDIGYCMYELGRYDEAISKFDEYLATANPNDLGECLARYYKAFCFLGKDDLDAGLRNLQETQKKFPERNDMIQRSIDRVVEEKKRIEAEQKKDNSACCF